MLVPPERVVLTWVMLTVLARVVKGDMVLVEEKSL